ncbi:MAG: hypothetical protein WCI29_04280 [Actinomycetes bacterium]|jgi:hypothetical protein
MRVRVYAVVLTSLAILAALPTGAEATPTKATTSPIVHADNWPNCC